MNYKLPSGQTVSDLDPNIEDYKSQGAVPIEDQKSDVSMVSSNMGVDAVNQDKGYLDNVTQYTSAQYDKDLTTEKAAKEAEAKKSTVNDEIEGGYTLEEMVDLIGNDFTGVTKKGDKYYPDASALVRAGISGLTEESQTAQMENDLMEANNRIENMINDFNSYSVDEDPAYQTYANNIRSEYDKMRRQMEDTNMRRQRALDTLGLRGGTTRYAGGVQSGIISEEVTQANERIADINRQEQQAIAEARQAFESNSYSKFAQKIDSLKTLREQKAEALEMYNNKLVAANEELKEQQEFELDILKFQLDLEKESSTTDTKEYNLAREQGFEGDFMDYLVTKEEMKIKYPNMPTSYTEWTLAGGEQGTGKTYAEFIADTPDQFKGPTSYQEWSLAGGEAGTGKTYAQFIGGLQGLPNTIINQIDKISSSFDSAQIVKNFNDVTNKKISVDAILDGGVGGPRDLALVFEFMKALDPTSVVRESEYDSASKSGNIFAGWAAKFNGYLREEGGFLPDKVKTEFQDIIQSKFEAIERQYDNFRSEKARLINVKTGDVNGLDYLIDYKIDTETPLGESNQNINYESEIDKAVNGGQIKQSEWDEYIKMMNNQGLYFNKGFTAEDAYNFFKNLGKISNENTDNDEFVWD